MAPPGRDRRPPVGIARQRRAKLAQRLTPRWRRGLLRSRQPLSSRVVSSVVSVPTSVPNSRKRNVQIRPNCLSTESSLVFVVWS